MQLPQVRLTERVIKIIRGSHPHMEALLISGGEFRQSVTELEIDRSFTVVDMQINPWEIKESSSSSMEVDDSAFRQRGKRNSGSTPGSAVLTISAGRLTFGWAHVKSRSLVWSQSAPQVPCYHQVRSAWSAVSITAVIYWVQSAQRLSAQLMRQEVVVKISSHHKGSVSNVRSMTCLPHWLKKRGLLSSYSDSSSCRLISRHCHVSHAQMHADFKGPNPDP